MPANTREIRRRIRSVKNTSQITGAMQMVATSKMRRAQQTALAGRPYALALNRMLVALRGKTDPALHPLLEVREVKKELVVAFATDRGLCGALNTNLARELNRLDPGKTVFAASGRKIAQFLARAKRPLLADFPLKDPPTFAETRLISKFCLDKFLSGEVDKVSVLYSRFVNTLTQQPVVRTVLPICPIEVEGTAEAERAGSDYLFEPGPQEVLDAVLPLWVHLAIFQVSLEARASEHSARMVAMKNATENAKALIKELTLEYNQVRQTSITTELLEIATAQMALG
jgi:F-type H+-transporting ATPase subunit gamma